MSNSPLRTPNGRRVLVAEDNDGARMILADLLRLFGYEVDAVVHGLAAVEAVRDRDYDVILMDCNMPVLDGLDATRAIRASDRGRRAIIIAVTGENNRDECIAAGMDDFLAKPVRPPVLRATLTRWLEAGHNHSSAPSPDTGSARSAG
jgi:two-component system, sensor histidine kinase and response regulator